MAWRIRSRKSHLLCRPLPRWQRPILRVSTRRSWRSERRDELISCWLQRKRQPMGCLVCRPLKGASFYFADNLALPRWATARWALDDLRERVCRYILWGEDRPQPRAAVPHEFRRVEHLLTIRSLAMSF